MTRLSHTLPLLIALAAPGFAAAQETAADPSTDFTDFTDLTIPDELGEERQSRYCPDREPRPAWMDEASGDDAYRVTLVMEIYRARTFQRIAETGDCSCDNRAPPWDAAEAEYLENFASLDYWGALQVERDLHSIYRDLRREVRALCIAAGNW